MRRVVKAEKGLASSAIEGGKRTEDWKAATLEVMDVVDACPEMGEYSKY